MRNIITQRFNKERFLSVSPKFIGRVLHIRFYGHPFHLTQGYLIVVDGDQCGLTRYLELPTSMELVEDLLPLTAEERFEYANMTDEEILEELGL